MCPHDTSSNLETMLCHVKIFGLQIVVASSKLNYEKKLASYNCSITIVFMFTATNLYPVTCRLAM